MNLDEKIKRMRERVPAEMISSRQQGGANLDYISWHDAADLLDDRIGDWSVEIREVGTLNGKIFVRLAITIDGVSRENIGFEDEDKEGAKQKYGDVFSNAWSMAFRRCAATWGLARHLYSDKASSQPQKSFAAKQSYSNQRQEPPVAQTMSDLVTPKQLTAIRAISNAKRIDADAECFEFHKCKPDELSRKTASAFIDHLQTYAEV